MKDRVKLYHTYKGKEWLYCGPDKENLTEELNKWHKANSEFEQVAC